MHHGMALRASRDGTAFARSVACLAALAPAAASAAIAAGTASATTAPGSVYSLRVNVTDSQVVIVPRRVAGRYVSRDGHSARFPRGVLIHFEFTNRGTKTYVPAIRFTDNRNANPYAPKQTLATADPVRPGRHVSLFGNFYFRGAFVIEELLHKKPHGRTVAVTIF